MSKRMSAMALMVSRFRLCAVGVTVLAAVLAVNHRASTQEPAVSGFTRASVDFGIVCSDVEASVAFYRDVVGLMETPGFSVSPEMGADAGLTDSVGVDIRVMVADTSATATRVKLMQFGDGKGQRPGNDFIHTSLGMSYTTFWVKDVNAALVRCKAHDIKPLAKSPVALPGDIHLLVIRDPDGNFVELVGPRL